MPASGKLYYNHVSVADCFHFVRVMSLNDCVELAVDGVEKRYNLYWRAARANTRKANLNNDKNRKYMSL